MSNENELIYRIISQVEGLTIEVQTTPLPSKKEAVAIGIGEIERVGLQTNAVQPCVALPITTQERWDSLCINFCPRCGSNITDYELESIGDFECFECNANLHINID